MKLASVDAAERGAIVPGMSALAPLPDPVRIQDVRVIRSPWGYRPIPSCLNGEPFPTLTAGVQAALAAYQEAHEAQETVWLRAGTGAGSAVLDIQGILLLQAALGGGVDRP